MSRSRLCLLAGVLLLARPAASVQAQAGGFDLEAVRRIVSVSSPAISPDGKRIVVVASRPDYDKNRFNSELVLVDVASGAQRVLTFDRPDVGQPAWSPDGNQLAFLAAGDEKSGPQIWVLPLAGGEARRITMAPPGVQQFAWRPDGQALAYVTADEAPKVDGEARHLNAFEVSDNDLFLREPYRPSHIWLVPVAGGEPKRLTSGGWTVEFVMPPGSPPSPLQWSPDGKTIAFARLPAPVSGKTDSATVQLLDVGSGAIRSLTGAGRFESTPAFSPSGTQVAYWHPRDGRGDLSNVLEVYLAPAAGGPGRSLTRGLDRNLFLSEWLPDSRGLVVAGNDATTVGLWVQPLDGAARRIDLGDVVIAGSFGYDVTVGKDGSIALVGSTPGRPAELYHLASPTSPVRRLTGFNDATAALALGRVERITWTSDGMQADGVVVYPADFSADKVYPLVLVIHGGPTAASKTSFSVLPQLMASEGWIVFSPNYRGSDNLGNAFQTAIVGDAGKGPGRDVMAGVAELRKRKYVDPKRTAVTGWSYGGFMTTWLIGNYPGEWQAAMAGAPVTDLEDQYHFADFNVQARYAVDGRSPWAGDARSKYVEQSPVTYVGKVRTPTLVMSNVEDFRVPPTQAYRYWRALKDQGVETQFIAIPGRTHFPGDPVRSRDVYRRWVEWVRRHIERGVS